MSILANYAQPIAHCPVFGVLALRFFFRVEMSERMYQKMKGYEVVALL